MAERRRRWLLILKIVLFLAIVGGMGYALYSSYKQLGEQHVDLTHLDWRFAPVAVLGFCGVMLSSGAMWRWLATKMGDRSPFVPTMGAYTYSQLGKYIPGKVALLLMRIERSGRFGMKASVCTIATLLENALYMISGALAGIAAIAQVAGELAPAKQTLVWPVTILVVVVLGVACHPKIFYGLINWAMRRFKKPEVPKSRQLKMGTLLVGVIGFLPCWLFGGVALWGAACCVQPIGFLENWWFAGAFALSVIIGMASMMPGGFGFREAVLTATLTIPFSATGMGHGKAFVLAGAVAVLQRVFQLVAEGILGVAGAVLTRAPVETTENTRGTEKAT